MDIMNALRRIISSQKAIMTLVGSGLAVLGWEQGFSEEILQVVGGLFAVLIAVQGALDYKHGSPSDKTGDFSEGV